MKKQTRSEWKPISPDMVMFNGNIITVDSDFSIAEAVAVKDNKIIGVGSNTEMKKLAKKVGLDVRQLEKDANSEEIQAMVRRQRDFAATIGVRGTPAFIIGSELVRGYIGEDSMKAKIADARKDG